MPKIKNVSRRDIETKTHPEAPVLIQIVDDAQYFPTPAECFEDVYKFVFLDVDESTPEFLPFAITQLQAKAIVEILQDCLKSEKDVVIHCTAGLCRSGAVVEVAEILGFKAPPPHTRQPNVYVKKQLMRTLGLTYDS